LPRWKKRWFRNSSRHYLARYNRAFGKAAKPGMFVLDAGAGRAPYRGFFKHATYESADFKLLQADQTYICDLTDIPVEDGRYDRVVLNQVLEHLPDPAAALRELYRVTKPGGELICTVPLFYEEHQKPYDFFRYTQFGLRKLFADAGFSVRTMEWMEGYFGTVGYQFEGMHRHLPRTVPSDLGRWQAGRTRLLLGATRGLGLLLAGLFYRLDMEWKYTRTGYPKNYVIIAGKPR
jgi:SAM-dependent methyltransferase